MDFSKQVVYDWCKNPISWRDWDETHLIDTALVIHATYQGFGYELIADELNFSKGLIVSGNRVWLCCLAQGESLSRH